MEMMTPRPPAGEPLRVSDHGGVTEGRVDVAGFLEDERVCVERLLDANLPSESEYPTVIHEAIRYSALGGGKRIRPILARAAVRVLGFDPGSVSKAACAIEYVHCCSLVLDDLPSMDDAATRRGRPTLHRAFGVATAILAADALLMHAFRLVADNGAEVGSDGRGLSAAVSELAIAVGSYGMVGGQHVDLVTAGLPGATAETVEYIQSRKTAALFVVASTIGGRLMGSPEGDLATLAAYARNVGLCYQIVDDILDAESDAETLGKDVGQDAGKPTFVTLRGIDGARTMAAGLSEEACAILGGLDVDTMMLEKMARHCVRRVS